MNTHVTYCRLEVAALSVIAGLGMLHSVPSADGCANLWCDGRLLVLLFAMAGGLLFWGLAAFHFFGWLRAYVRGL